MCADDTTIGLLFDHVTTFDPSFEVLQDISACTVVFDDTSFGQLPSFGLKLRLDHRYHLRVMHAERSYMRQNLTQADEADINHHDIWLLTRCKISDIGFFV